MRAFSQLYFGLEQATNSEEKVMALKRYFLSGDPMEQIWVLAFLLGKYRPVPIKAQVLIEALHLKTDLPDWIIQDSFKMVGDWVESISLLAVNSTHQKTTTQQVNWLDCLSRLEQTPLATKAETLVQIWSVLSPMEILVFNMLISTKTRFGVKQRDVILAISEALGLEPADLSNRLGRNWSPETFTFHEILFGQNSTELDSKPFPFEPSPKLEKMDELGEPSHYFAEWKLEGTRLQVIRRNGTTFCWTREYEKCKAKMPELEKCLANLPDGTVLDAQLINDPTAIKQGLKRTEWKKVNEKEADDYFLVAFDLLEFKGEDIRKFPLFERRILLEKLVTEIGQNHLFIAPQIDFSNWSELDDILSRARDFEAGGIILKPKSAAYQSNSWISWSPKPLVIQAVLLYVQKGTDNLYSEWTVGLWDENGWVPLTKVKSTLSVQENMQLSFFVKENTVEKFGPVRNVKPELVFEISFQGIQPSRRHKSGFLVKEPKVVRWLKEVNWKDTHSLKHLKAEFNKVK